MKNVKVVLIAVIILIVAFFVKKARDNQANYDLQAAKLDAVIAVDSKRINAENAKEKAEREAYINSWKKDLDFKYKDYRKGGFGNVGLHDFSIRNKSKNTYWKDLQLRITYYGSSETKLGSQEEILYERVPPGKTINKHKYNTGFVNQQANKALIELVGATPM